MKEIAEKLKKAIAKTKPTTNKDCAILFSGGLDSSIVAAINPGLRAFSVNFQGLGEDLKYSKKIAQALGLNLTQLTITKEQAIEAIPQVIKILKSFDPAIPNDLAVYFGIKAAKEAGFKEIMTGDASDELFAGYSFMQGIPNLDAYIAKINLSLNFSSKKIADYFGIKIIQPFLNKEVVELALEIPASLKIKEQAGKLHGKWILRQAFDEILPNNSAWQSKRPLEAGSGMSHLRDIVESLVTQQEFEADLDGIKFINREHRYYYRIYKSIFGLPILSSNKPSACPACGSDRGKRDFHCAICGWSQPLSKQQPLSTA